MGRRRENRNVTAIALTFAALPFVILAILVILKGLNG